MMRRVVYDDKNIIIDSGINYGRGVFETILVKEKAILLKEHIDRLNKSIKILNIGDDIDCKEVKSFIAENGIKNKALKVIVTEKNVIYSTRDIPYSDKDYLNGFKVRYSRVIRNSTSKLTYIKSLNYLDNLLEYEDVKKEGFNESIFLNENGNVCEGCTTNIFVIKEGDILTPNIESGLLPGILRQWIISNFHVKEVKINKELLLTAEEIFLTNSLLGVMKVSDFEGKRYNGKTSDNIRKTYEKFLMEV